MSEPERANRMISGLGPRPTYDASRLIKEQRESAAPAEGTKKDEPKPRPADAKARTASKTAKKPATAAAKGAQVPVAVYVPDSLRRRARAAYRATGHLEDDRTFSHMIEKMMEDGVAGRERQHNEGRAFAGGEDQLSAGRPLNND